MKKIPFVRLELSRRPLYKSKNTEEITKSSTCIVILPDFCKGCEICVEFCPKDILKMSEELNTRSYHFPYIISLKTEDCSQCRLCERLCPDLAIFLVEKNVE